MAGTVSVGSGLAAQLAAASETTWGVAASLASSPHCYEFKSETLELKKTAVVGEGLAAGHVYPRTRRRVLTNYDANGAVTMEAPTRQLGFWLQYMIGSFGLTPTQIGSSGIYKTVFQPGAAGMQGKSFTLQKGVPTVDTATVEPFTYVGCKLSKWEVSVSTGAIASLVLTIDARNELGGVGNSDPLNGSVPPLATWALAAPDVQGDSLWHFREATIFTGGAATYATGGTAAGTTPSVPATTVPVVNTNPYEVVVQITGGTGITSVIVEGVQVGTSAGTYTLPQNASISIAYTTAPTWTWDQIPVGTPAPISLAGSTAMGNVKDATVTGTYSYDTARYFLGGSGFKFEQIENGYRGLSGALTVEWLSSEAAYEAFAADTTTSLELTFTGPTVGTSNYLLDIIIPNIKFEGESPKVSGPKVVTQQLNFWGGDDETTVPIQVTYQSEDSAI